jgi:hypothetical protein
MSLNIWSSSSKILITEVNFRRTKAQEVSVDLQELLGKIECLIKCIIKLVISKESNMVLLTLQMILKESTVVPAMELHISY